MIEQQKSIIDQLLTQIGSRSERYVDENDLNSLYLMNPSLTFNDEDFDDPDDECDTDDGLKANKKQRKKRVQYPMTNALS